MNIVRVAQRTVTVAQLHQHATKAVREQMLQTSPLQTKHDQFVKQPAIRSFSMSSTRRFSESSDAQTITLRSGHTLGYATYGSPSGTPILFFHGVPSSRIEPRVIDGLAKKYNARIISVDRPGIGLSSFQPQRRILDWPSDVAQLTSQLGLKDFRVCGGSGGGPYALACARGIPTADSPTILEPPKLTAVVSGSGPWSMGTKGMPLFYRLIFNIAAWSPATFGWLLYRVIGKAAHTSDDATLKKKWRAQAKYISKRDAAKLTEDEMLDTLVSLSREAFRQGSRGVTKEYELLTRYWGFDLGEVKGKVEMWCGEDDRNTPLRVAKLMTEQMPDARLHVVKSGTHFDMEEKVFEEVLEALTKK